MDLFAARDSYEYNLGVMHATGQGVNPDYVVAYAWCDIAATNELKNAIEAKPIVAKEMTADQITKAEALATEMIKRNPKLLN